MEGMSVATKRAQSTAKKWQPAIEQIKLSELRGYERNARTHSEDQLAELAKSITEFGFVNPVLVDAKNVLVAGHGRVEAAKRLNLDTVPAIRMPEHWSETQKRAYILADNKLAMNAGWDWDILRGELDALTKDGFDFAATGFSKDEIDTMVGGGIQDWDSAFQEDHPYVEAAGRVKTAKCPKCKHEFKLK